MNPKEFHQPTVTDEQALKLVNEMPASTCNFLQNTVAEKLANLITQLANDLAKMTPSELAKIQQQLPTSAAKLGMAGKKLEAAARQRRELATMLVMGALINKDNFQWNPLDPTSHQPSSGGIIGALLSGGAPNQTNK